MKKIIKIIKFLIIYVVPILILLLMIATLRLNYLSEKKEEEWKLKQKELEQTPFSKYEYSKEKNAFEIKGGENLDIKRVRWIYPEGHNHPAISLSDIAENSMILTINDIEEAVLTDFERTLEPDADPSLIYGFVKCGVLLYAAPQDWGQFGLSFITEIEYEYKGSEKSFLTIDLIRIKGLNTEFPVVRVFRHNASEDEINVFATDATNWLNRIFKMINENPDRQLMSDDSDCVIRLDGYPWLEYYKNIK